MPLNKNAAEYWSGVETLTIKEAGYLLYGIEPTSFMYEEECSLNAHPGFDERDAGYDIVCLSEIVERAALSGNIEIVHQAPDNRTVFDWKKTHLKKSSFLSWCKSVPKYAFVATALDLTTYQKAAPTSINRENEHIPGKMAHTAVGKLAIKAAWEIEQSTNQHASPKDVMNRLQEWAKEGKHADILQKPDPLRRGVVWVTGKGRSKIFDQDACGKALSKWRLSRA